MLEEHVSAISSFADDLRALGIAESYVAKAICLYVNALLKPSRRTWGLLYRHVSDTLQQCPGELFEPNAAQRLYALLDDDFARNVLETPARGRLRNILLQYQFAS